MFYLRLFWHSVGSLVASLRLCWHKFTAVATVANASLSATRSFGIDYGLSRGLLESGSVWSVMIFMGDFLKRVQACQGSDLHYWVCQNRYKSLGFMRTLALKKPTLRGHNHDQSLAYPLVCITENFWCTHPLVFVKFKVGTSAQK